VRAMVLERFGEPLRLTERPEPEPGPGEVLVAVRACGVCGTDLKITGGKLPNINPPRIPGHEAAGVVAKVGEGVSGLAPGMPVTLYYYVSCGHCRNCRSGRGTICTDFRGRLGFERDGGFAEYVLVPAENCIPIPADMSFADAGVLEDAVATPYHALVTRGGLRAGETVLVMGSGGLGLHAIQVAHAAGAFVVAVDVDESHLELALHYGADRTIRYTPGSYAEDVRRATDGELDMVVETVSRPETIRQNAEALHPGGRLVLIGYSPGTELLLETSHTVLSEITVLGSRAAGRHEVEAAVELVARGLVRPVITARYRLEDVNDALEALRQGRTVGRAVVEI
jgi:D-arabinose 1-dehydrogenase-like Zn-dependent alcohol dehydrogenase